MSGVVPTTVTSPAASPSPGDPFNYVIHHTPIANADDVDNFAQFGGCTTEYSTHVDCTLTPTDCKDAVRPFVSGLDLKHSEFHLNKEPCDAADLKTVKCAGTGTVGTCAVGGCGANDGGTKIADNNCNLVRDTKLNAATLYGGCKEKFSNALKGCFWSEVDCAHNANSDEVWLTPDEYAGEVYKQQREGTMSDSVKGFCDCGDVMVGACRTDYGQLVCAVGPEQCGENEAYVTARTMLDNPSIYGEVHCRLCEESEVEGFVAITTRTIVENSPFVQNYGVVKEAPKTDVNTNTNTNTNTDAPKTTSQSSGNDQGAVAAMVLGPILGLLFLFAAAYCIRRNCCAGVETKERGMHNDEDTEQPSEIPAEGRSID